jgi:2-(1,2-epoxy-1,2-dihydrophenyl)acetyl-CoA isomerase
MSVTYELRDDVALITFDRPERYNAIEAGLSAATTEALQRAGAEARSAVITGAGKAFCSGADLADLIEDYRRDGPDLNGHLERVFHPMVESILDCKVPTVAAVNGAAAGAGLGIALACDLRVMGASGSFTSAFTGIALVPDSGTTWWLPQMVGVSKAMELALTNRKLSAEEAVSLGLAVEVVADGELIGSAVALAARLSDLPTDALVTTRRLIRDAAAVPFHTALQAEQEEQGRLGRSPAHMEGVNAFLEKRKPDYRNIG